MLNHTCSLEAKLFPVKVASVGHIGGEVFSGQIELVGLVFDGYDLSLVG